MASVSSSTIWLHKGPSIFNLRLLVFFNWDSLVMDRDSWFFTRWVSGLTKTILNKICGSHFYFTHIENHTPVEIWRIHQKNFTRGLTNHSDLFGDFSRQSIKTWKSWAQPMSILVNRWKRQQEKCQCPNIVLNSKATFCKRKLITWHSPVKAVIVF